MFYKLVGYLILKLNDDPTIYKGEIELLMKTFFLVDLVSWKLK